MGFASSLLTLLIAAGLPVAGALFLSDRDKGYMKAFLGGVMAYAALQLLGSLPPLNTLMETLAPTGPVIAIYGTALVLAAVSETGRFLIFKYYLPERGTAMDAIALGFGHWSIEAILSVGLTALTVVVNYSTAAAQVDPVNMALAGLERLFVLPVLVLLSLISLCALKSGKYYILAFSVIFHCALNGTTNFLVTAGFAPALVIAIMGVTSLVCCYLIFRLYSSPLLSGKDK